jgi:hypothetical protein
MPYGMANGVRETFCLLQLLHQVHVACTCYLKQRLTLLLRMHSPIIMSASTTAVAPPRAPAHVRVVQCHLQPLIVVLVMHEVNDLSKTAAAAAAAACTERQPRC